MSPDFPAGSPEDEIEGVYRQHGAVVLRGFYDVERDIAPVREGIRDIISRLAVRHGVAVDCSNPISAMVRGYPALIAADRSHGGQVYDAVKQIPSFLRLVAHPRNEAIYRVVAREAVSGIASGGSGIRIDNPGEEKFRAQWHQEFPAQLRSADGMVFWSPLLDVTEDMGPVQVLPGSHREGFLGVHDDAGDAGRTGAYALFLDNEAEIVARYPAIAPMLRAGDLLIMDFMTVHQSGYNVSDRPRWSMQFRYFNFADPVGTSIGWTGSFAAGIDFQQIVAGMAGRVNG